LKLHDIAIISTAMGDEGAFAVHGLGAELLGGVVEGEEFLHLIEQEDEAGRWGLELLDGICDW
jgi:hypothetical protein